MQDYKFTREDLLDVMTFVKQQVEAVITENFTGRHLIAVNRPWEHSITGQIWAAFVIHYDASECTNVTMQLFDNEHETNDYLDDIADNGTKAILATRH